MEQVFKQSDIYNSIWSHEAGHSGHSVVSSDNPWRNIMMLLSSLRASSCHLQAAAWRQSNSSSPVSSLATGTDGSAVSDDLRNVTQRPPAPPETFRVAHRNSFLDFPTLPAFCLIEKCFNLLLLFESKKTNNRYITGIGSYYLGLMTSAPEGGFHSTSQEG